MLPVVSMNDLRPGDILFRTVDRAAPLMHFGCFAEFDYLGRAWVFEHCEGKGCQLSPYDVFAKGYQVYVERIPEDKRAEAVRRMRELLDNPREYDLIGFNCEHAKNYITKGVVYSIQALLFIGAFLAGVYAVAKSK